MKSKATKLSDQEELFCNEYLVDRNKSQAALRSGYGNNLKTSGTMGCNLFKKLEIQARIKELMAEITARIQLNTEDILNELSRIGYADIRGIMTDEGAIKDVKNWPDDIARCVASIEIVEEFEGYGKDRTWTGYTKKVRFWDKTKALELLGRSKAMFSDKVKHEISTTLEALVAGSMKNEKTTEKEE